MMSPVVAINETKMPEANEKSQEEALSPEAARRVHKTDDNTPCESLVISPVLLAENKETSKVDTLPPDNGRSRNGRDRNQGDSNKNSNGQCKNRPLPNDGMSEIGLEAEEEEDEDDNNDGDADADDNDEEDRLALVPRRNSEGEALLNGRLSCCTTETQSMKSDSDMDLSSDENGSGRQLQLKMIALDRRLTELTTTLAEEKERRICDLTHFQKEKEDMLVKQELLLKELEKLKKDKESAVMKYAKSEHEAITAGKAKDALEKKLHDVTKERDTYVGKIRQLNQDYGRLASRLEARAGDLNKLERVIDRLTDEKSKAQQRLQDLEKYCDKLLAEQQQELLKTATEQVKEISEKLEETKGRLAECQKERDELLQRVEHLEDANRAHHENLSLSQMEIERLRAGLDQALEDHAGCGERAAEGLQFTQQLTESTLRSQAENEQLKAQVSLLSDDLSSLRERNVELERDLADTSKRLWITSNERKCLGIRLADVEKERDALQRRTRELEHEKAQVRRKSEQNVKQLSKELQIARKKLDEQLVVVAGGGGGGGSGADGTAGTAGAAGLSAGGAATTSVSSNAAGGGPHHRGNAGTDRGADRGAAGPIQLIDQSMLIERIVKLQKNLARKSEKIEFLEEHNKELLSELNRKRGR